MSIVILLLLAGGGIFAAFHGIFGAVAKADVQKYKADVIAEFEKVEGSVSAEVKKILADLKSKL